MNCKQCSSRKTVIIETRKRPGEILRLHLCHKCSAKFETIQIYAIPKPTNKTTKVFWKTPRNFGEDNPNSVMLVEDIQMIRKLYQQGISQRKIAVKYGLTSGHVCRIVNFKAWTHVEAGVTP